MAEALREDIPQLVEDLADELLIFGWNRGAFRKRQLASGEPATRGAHHELYFAHDRDRYRRELEVKYRYSRHPRCGGHTTARVASCIHGSAAAFTIRAPSVE